MNIFGLLFILEWKTEIFQKKLKIQKNLKIPYIINKSLIFNQKLSFVLKKIKNICHRRLLFF